MLEPIAYSLGTVADYEVEIRKDSDIWTALFYSRELTDEEGKPKEFLIAECATLDDARAAAGRWMSANESETAPGA